MFVLWSSKASEHILSSSRHGIYLNLELTQCQDGKVRIPVQSFPAHSESLVLRRELLSSTPAASVAEADNGLALCA